MKIFHWKILLRQILKSQNELKQEMNGIMVRVHNIECQNGIKGADSSLSSSSTSATEGKEKRLPSDLSVVACILFI